MMVRGPRLYARLFTLLFGTAAVIGFFVVGRAEFPSLESLAARQERLMPGSCTIFSVSKGGSVFFGNNEDWRNPLTFIWVEPAGEGKYSVLCAFFYDRHQYDRVAKLDVAETIRSRQPPRRIKDLFPQEMP